MIGLLLLLGCNVTMITGTVVRVADGDTFTLLMDDNTTVRVRLYGIDCPERGQPYSRAATNHLKTLLEEGNVKVKEMDIDRYGRTVGMVYVGPINVNESLLANGFAWHSKAFDGNPAWAALEEDARAQRLGLWSQPNALAPWDWRKRKR